MVLTIHQPEHLPWLGFFDKIRQADVFAMLDHVQFRKNYYQNRNRVRAAQGPVWLTVPVLTKDHSEQSISEVQINNRGEPRWKEKAWNSLVLNYHGTTFWREHEEFFAELYKKEWTLLVEINEAIIRYMLPALSGAVRIVKSSQLAAKGHGSDLLLNICREVGADVYLSGVSGKEYLDLDKFAEAGIEVRFQSFHHPIYTQRYEPFIPCMSAVDLLFNYGPASADVIKGVGVKTLDHVFE